MMSVDKFGEWHVGTLLAKDVRGSVYVTYQNQTSSQHAILYQFNSLSTFLAGFDERLKDYVRQAKKIDHPNIVRVLDGGVSQGRAYLVTEGRWEHNLENTLRTGTRLDWVQVLLISMSLVSALRFIHRRGLIHRDLRPCRIFRDPATQEIKVSHAGLEELFSTEAINLTDNTLGPAGFISPEQYAGKKVTKKSDFYSLGCTLYALLTTRTPFAANNIAELMNKHLHALPERPIHLVPDLPDELDNLVTRLLNKDPSTRPSSGTLLLEELEKIWQILQSQGKVGIRPPAAEELLQNNPAPQPATSKILPKVTPSVFTPPPAPPKPLTRRWWIVLPALIIVVGVLIGAFFWKSTPSAETLYGNAQPLMNSADPNDWRTAWKEYLEPLSKSYPEEYAQEIKDFKRKLDCYEDFQKTLTGQARREIQTSEGERLYRRGVRLLEGGETNLARQLWERLVTGYSGVPSEKVWVDLAELSLQKTAAKPQTEHPSTEALNKAFERIETLQKADNHAEADKMIRALKDLYRDDPDAQKALNSLRSKTVPKLK